MPVEIKELIIRTNIVSDDSHKAESAGRFTERQMRDIVESCVERVLRVIDKKKER
ncbi:DUF5908 family protein [Marinoscillum sp.]|uniref:DUF5908 family protein n=1 Tax=Marinoscillum sp. TaxID=2024838 RepID=UPI003BA86FC7